MRGTSDTTIKRIGGTIGEVSQIATSIGSAVEQQGAATQEITRNAQRAARRTQDVSGRIAGVTTATDATGAAAQGVETAAAALGQQAEQLRHQVTDFLGKIRGLTGRRPATFTAGVRLRRGERRVIPGW